MQAPAEAGLIRGIGKWDLAPLAINGIIGAGIFGLPSDAFRLTRTYSVLAFITCAAIVTLVILCFAEVSSRFGETGGPYLYARKAFGSAAGFEVGWMLWLARLTAFAANCNLLVAYVTYFVPGAAGRWPRVLIICAVLVALTTINCIGVRDAARTTSIFTVVKLLPLLLFIAAGLFYLAPQNYSLASPPSYGPFSSAVLVLVYAFTGFEMAVIPAGEIENPQREVPRAILLAIAVVTVLYILIQIVCIGTLPGLATSTRPLADASSAFLGPVGGSIIAAGAMLSIIPNLNVIILAGSRLPFAMALREELPPFLSATHRRFHTPHVSILATAVIMLVITLSWNFIHAVAISTIARLLAYVVTCASLPVLRRKEQSGAAGAAAFNLPGGNLIAVFTLALAAWLLTNASGAELRDSGIAAAAGLAFYYWFKIARRLRKGRALPAQ